MKLGPWNDPNLRWVCEDHPTKDQEHRLFFGFGRECGGAGMPDPESRWAIENEIDEMVAAYKKEYPHANNLGFLVGSSLVGNHQGDSARFWELQKKLEALKAA